MAARRDPLAAIVAFFMVADLKVARAALVTASTIVKTREAQPAPPAPRVSGAAAPGVTAPKPRRKRRTRAEMRAAADAAAGVVTPKTTTPAETTTPAAQPAATTTTTTTAPRRRRTTAAKPATTAAAPDTAAAGGRPPVPTDDIAHVPGNVSAFPPQDAPGE